MLLREAAEVPPSRSSPLRSRIEVLVVRRHANLAFMGGQWVFPGGALCPADTSADCLALIPPQSKVHCAQLADLRGAELGRSECLGLAVAAYRETFEETGVLLATDADGHHCRDDLLIRLQGQRHAVASKPESFAALLHGEGLVLDVDRLKYWAHWITPSVVPRRFDTRFFVVTVPPEQTAAIDTIEAVDHAWMTPAALIAAANAGTMPVPQPTLFNLMELDACLDAHGSLAAMLESAKQRRVVPILPKLIQNAGTVMVLPWDPEYVNLAGESSPADIEYPRALLELPSRVSSRG